MAHQVAQEKVEAKFDKLIQEGQYQLNQSGFDGQKYNYELPSRGNYVRFRAEAMNLIQKVCGASSSHYQAIERLAKKDETAYNPFFYAHCFGILEAAHRDFKDGLLSEIRLLVRADFLDDFLSQAEALLEQGFHMPAASLAGAVLEDSMRKLCDKNSIAYPAKTKIDALNVELARADVYDKLIQKEITAKADLRNNADHGHFDKVRKEDVPDMVRWIRRFVTERLN
jgi:hypothetical protein